MRERLALTQAELGKLAGVSSATPAAAKDVEKNVMRDVGRNDPCPCGSGEKYKRCHLAVEETALRPASQRAQARHTIDQRIVSEMLRFASRQFPDRNPVAEFEDGLGGNADDAQLFAPWAVYHWMVDEGPVVDWYRETQANRLSSVLDLVASPPAQPSWVY